MICTYIYMCNEMKKIWGKQGRRCLCVYFNNNWCSNVKIILKLTSFTSWYWPYYLLDLLERPACHPQDCDDISPLCWTAPPARPQKLVRNNPKTCLLSHSAWLEGCMLRTRLRIPFYFCEACFKDLKKLGDCYSLDLCTVTDLIIRSIILII